MKTRMHEILGVEPFEKFQVVGGYEGRNYSLDKDGWMRWGDSNWESDVEDVYNAINNGIIRKPRLTNEQEEQLKAYECIRCGTTTRNYEKEEEEKAAWNRVMGYKEADE